MITYHMPLLLTKQCGKVAAGRPLLAMADSCFRRLTFFLCAIWYVMQQGELTYTQRTHILLDEPEEPLQA